jgi:predicted transcriptional regulator YdeE
MGELTDVRVGDDAFGVARALPGVTHDRFEYLAAVEVNAFDHLPEGMVGWEIPALTYAVLPANDVPDIGPVSDYFYKQWLPQSQDYIGGEPLMMEVYPETYGHDLIMYLYFPVQSKHSAQTASATAITG